MIPVLLTTNIIPENECANAVCESIFEAIEAKGSLLTAWANIHEEYFGNTHDIPHAKDLSVAKLSDHGVITTDTCNAAKSINRKIGEQIIEIAKTENLFPDLDPIIRNEYCHHHLRNILINAMNKKLSRYLSIILREDIEMIDNKLRITTNFELILRAVDKCFSLCCNYPKGHGEAFKAWFDHYHPGTYLMGIQRASGSRQDLTVEGSGAVYFNRQYFLEFLTYTLSTGEHNNILTNNLYVVLRSSEMIGLTRVYSIFHLAFCLPMRFLAGKTHQLAQYNWSC